MIRDGRKLKLFDYSLKKKNNKSLSNLYIMILKCLNLTFLDGSIIHNPSYP